MASSRQEWWEWVDGEAPGNEPLMLREDAPEEMKKNLKNGNARKLKTRLMVYIHKNMTEQEFIKIAKTKGVREENIKIYLSDFYSLKERISLNIRLDEYLADKALEMQNREENKSDDIVSLD